MSKSGKRVGQDYVIERGLDAEKATHDHYTHDDRLQKAFPVKAKQRQTENRYIEDGHLVHKAASREQDRPEQLHTLRSPEHANASRCQQASGHESG